MDTSDETELEKALAKIQRLETLIDKYKPALQTIKNEAERHYGSEVDATWLFYLAREVLSEDTP